MGSNPGRLRLDWTASTLWLVARMEPPRENSRLVTVVDLGFGQIARTSIGRARRRLRRSLRLAGGWHLAEQRSLRTLLPLDARALARMAVVER